MSYDMWHAAFEPPLEVDVTAFVRERTGIDVPACRALIHSTKDASEGPLWYGRRTQWWPDKVTYFIGEVELADSQELVARMRNYDANLPSNLFSMIGWAEQERLKKEGYN